MREALAASYEITIDGEWTIWQERAGDYRIAHGGTDHNQYVRAPVTFRDLAKALGDLGLFNLVNHDVRVCYPDGMYSYL